MSNYVFINSNNEVIDMFLFDNSSATDEIINTIKSQIGASTVIRYDDGTAAVNSVPAIPFLGSVIPGNSWDGVDTFLPPKPGENYILNISRTGWVEIPTNGGEACCP